MPLRSRLPLRLRRSSARRRQRFQLRQSLKRTPRHGAQLCLQSAQIAPHAQLTPVFIHHPQVHEQMRGQHVQLEVGALDIQTGFITHALEQDIGQRSAAKHAHLR